MTALDPNKHFTTWSVNTAAWLMGRGHEPVGAHIDEAGTRFLVFPVAARADMYALHALKERAADLLASGVARVPAHLHREDAMSRPTK